MSWHAHIKEEITDFFHPETSQDIRRLQYFWVGCGLLVIVGLSYGIVSFLFEKTPIQKQEENVKVTPTSIETTTSKVDLNGAWRHKVEEETQKLSDEITALKTLFQELAKSASSRDALSQDFPQEEISEDEESSSIHPLSKDSVTQEFETRILQLESQLESQKNSFASGRENNPYLSQSLDGRGDPEKNLIQKVSLELRENLKHRLPKTVETTIPAGAFAKTVLLSGLDASSSMTASSDPRPMLLRIIDPGTLPRRFQSDLKDCHCTASAYGDLSSERVYGRLEKLTCIERKTGEIIETQVAGYIAGSDGKAGIRGVVASKDGQFLARSFVGGIFAGLSNVANPQSRQSQVNPFYPGSAHVSPPNVGDMFTAGMAGGATTALDRLSQYYIDRAEQLQPVIQIAAGQVVDIVFTEGTFIGSQTVHSEIKAQRGEAHKAESE